MHTFGQKIFDFSSSLVFYGEEQVFCKDLASVQGWLKRVGQFWLRDEERAGGPLLLPGPTQEQRAQPG